MNRPRDDRGVGVRKQPSPPPLAQACGRGARRQPFVGADLRCLPYRPQDDNGGHRDGGSMRTDAVTTRAVHEPPLRTPRFRTVDALLFFCRGSDRHARASPRARQPGCAVVPATWLSPPHPYRSGAGQVRFDAIIIHGTIPAGKPPNRRFPCGIQALHISHSSHAGPVRDRTVPSKCLAPVDTSARPCS